MMRNIKEPGFVTLIVILLCNIFFLFSAPEKVQAEPSWQGIGPQGGTMLSLVQSPTEASTLYAGCYFGGLYKSVNYGGTWRHIASDFSQKSIFTIAINPTQSEQIYVGTFQRGMYRSDDGGLSWTACNSGITDLNIQSIAICPSNPQYLLAATTTKFYRSTDGGLNWSDCGLTYLGKDILFDPDIAGLVYLGTLDNGVMRSQDYGVNWQDYSGNMGKKRINDLAYDVHKKTILASSNMGLFQLSRLDNIWHNISYNLQECNVFEAYYAPYYASYLVATSKGIYYSEDLNLEPAWTLVANFQARVLLTYPNINFMQAAPLWGSLQATNNFGKTWFAMSSGIQNYFVGAVCSLNIKNYATVLYAGYEEGVFLTSELWGSENGLPWIEDKNLKEAVFDLQADPDEIGTIYAGTERSGVFKSIDWGVNWQQKSNGIVPTLIYSISQAAQAPYTLYAGTSAGLFVSRDNGQSWYLGTMVGVPANVLSVSADPVLPGVAFFSGETGEVYLTYDDCKTYHLANIGLPKTYISQVKAGGWEKAYAITGDGELYMTRNLGSVWALKSADIPEPVLCVDYDKTKNWILYAGTAGGGIYKSASEGSAWEKLVLSQAHAYIFSIATDPLNSNTIYAGTKNSVLKSSDGGASWTVQNNSLQGNVLQISINQNDSSVIYISCENSGLYKSLDSGLTWTPLALDAPQNQGFWPIELNPHNNDQLFCGTKVLGLYTSLNGGDTWQTSSNGLSLFIRSMEIDPHQSSTVYAASLSNGLFRSRDKGETWQNIGLGNYHLFDIAIDPKNSGNLYAATGTGIIKSVDGGISWQDYGQKASYITAMSRHPLQPQTIYLGAPGGVFIRSTDAGLTWKHISKGLPAWTILAIAVQPVNGDIYISLERNGVYKSSDGGVTWTSTDNALIKERNVRSLSFDNEGKALYAASDGGGIFKTLDKGQVWATVNNGLTGELAFPKVVNDPVDSQVCFIAGYKDGVYKSINAGMEWQKAGTGIPTAMHVYSLEINPHTPGIIFAATEKGIYKSTDAGQIWGTAHTGIGENEVSEICVSPFEPAVMFAGVKTKGLYRSLDAGLNWELVNGECANTVITKITYGKDQQTIYCSTIHFGFIISKDGGTTWSRTIDSSLVEPMTFAVKVNPINPNILYASVSGCGVIKSVDGGISWQNMLKGFGNVLSLTLAIDPVTPDTVYLGTDDGVLMTENGGLNWQYINDGLFNAPITSITLDAINHKLVYVGTEGGGVYRLTRQ
jgi:photosystem II stability/assembly factor-like uncharacterized protein